MHKMSMKIVAHSHKPLKYEEVSWTTFGGFGFTINGEDVPFDYEAYSIYPEDMEDGHLELTYYSGRGFMFNEFTLDSSYEEQYEDMGLNIEDITAEYLSQVTEIYELYHDLYEKGDEKEEYCHPIVIESISFYDLDDWDNPVEYKVKPEVIEAFNKKREEECKGEGWKE